MAEFKNHEQEINEMLLHKAELLKIRSERHWSSNFGMIASLGGVIITPLLLGILGGGWLDENYPQHFSWRLSGLFLGFLWGGINAYFWIIVENKKIERLNKITRSKKDE
jgi:predicted F0F1-ATPase subunit